MDALLVYGFATVVSVVLMYGPLILCSSAFSLLQVYLTVRVARAAWNHDAPRRPAGTSQPDAYDAALDAMTRQR